MPSAHAQEISEQNQTSQPLKFLSNEKFISAAQVGIDVAVDFNPEFKTLKTAADVTAVALDESVKSADARNAIVATHLVAINEDISRLQEIKERDGNLQSPEAQAILNNIRNDPFSADSQGMFLAKSVFSMRVVVMTAGHYKLSKWIESYFGEPLSKRLHIGEEAERIWISKSSPVRLYTDIRWKYLTRLGTGTRILGDKLMKAILNREGEELGKATFGQVLDGEVDRILKVNPSRRAAVYAVRLDIFNNPSLLVPAAPAVAVAEPAPAVAIVAVPQVVVVPDDPVIRPAYVQHQVIMQQSTHGGRNASDDEPPPSRNLPRSITQKDVGFDGASGGSFFGRF
jgi:hypothetical protein